MKGSQLQANQAGYGIYAIQFLCFANLTGFSVHFGPLMPFGGCQHHADSAGHLIIWCFCPKLPTIGFRPNL